MTNDSSPVLPIFTTAGCQSFEDFWALDLNPVDEPNNSRNGWSNVCRWEVGGELFYVKRQVNYFIRTLSHPLLGEPTLTREVANVAFYEAHHIPCMEVAYYESDKSRAICITRALVDHEDLTDCWSNLHSDIQQAVIKRSAHILSDLHKLSWSHRSFYTKHIFVNLNWQPGSDEELIRLIDLEKTRRFFWPFRDDYRDLNAFARRVRSLDAFPLQTFVEHYIRERQGAADDALVYLKRHRLV